MSVFSASEYAERLRKTKERMHEQGIEVLIVSHPANLNYLTGFDGWSFYVHQGLIVALDHDEPLWFGREQDSNAARLLTSLREEDIFGYPDHYVMSKLRHPMDFVSDILRERGWHNRAIGVEMEGYYFTAEAFRVLERNLPGACVKDGTLVVNLVRRIKSSAEIEYIRQAARIAEKVMNTALEAIAPGVRESNAAGEVYQAQISGTAEFGGDYTSLCPIMPSAERTSSAHLTWSPDRKYEKGDIVLLELAGARHHYHCPISRTLYLGEPHSELRRIADAVIKGLNETLEFIRPGITAEEVEQKWRESIAGTGVNKPSRVGYSFGLNYPPDWGEQTLSLRPGDATILQPGMCIHFMPGIWMKDFGFECSEPVAVTDSGCEPFLNFERKLFSK